MVEDLSKRFKREIKKDHLKNRLRTLKEHFAAFYDIFRGVSLSGFSWDPTTKLLGAKDEVWEALIANKPEAKKWKTKQIHHYEEMLELFSKDRATGVAAETTKDRRKRVEKHNSTNDSIEAIDEMLEGNNITLESFNTPHDFHVTSTQTKLLSTSKTKKMKIEQEEDPFTSMIMESIKNVADALDRSTYVLADALDRSTKVNESSRQRVYSEEEIYNELVLMGMVSEELSDAYLFLVEHPEKARALFGCPLNMRINMLGKMMKS